MPAETHKHAYTYPLLRILTLGMPDGYWRVYLRRTCRHCGRREDRTGLGTKRPPSQAPPLETFWDAPRTREE